MRLAYHSVTEFAPADVDVDKRDGLNQATSNTVRLSSKLICITLISSQERKYGWLSRRKAEEGTEAMNGAFPVQLSTSVLRTYRSS